MRSCTGKTLLLNLVEGRNILTCTPFSLFLYFCIEFYRIEQNEASKSCQNKPSWAGAWGAWVIVVFIRGCSPRPSIKNIKHPSSPNTRPRGQVLTTFWTPIVELSAELYASSPPQMGYQNDLQNDSVVLQYSTFGTLPRATLGDP